MDNDRNNGEELSYEYFLEEWKKLEQDFLNLEEAHLSYLSKLSEVHDLQQSCLHSIRSQCKRLSTLQEAATKFQGQELNEERKRSINDVLVEIGDCKNRLNDMTEELPRQSNGLYLNIILGSSLNVSLMSKSEKFRYKDEYEKFKITVTVVSLVVAVLAYVLQSRVTDAAFHFLLVWYYCTLTIRESILKINGSRIKGWWVFHHYASTVLCGVSLTWPEGVCYKVFRNQFLLFSMYVALVQLFQCQYQRGCLYRLRSLGHRHSMDITVEGFHLWMFKGLTFLLPTLVVGYIFQLYNSVTLLKIWREHSCPEWQVPVLALLFLLLSAGNTITTGQVCWKKLQESDKITEKHRLETKYSTSSSPSGCDKTE